MASKRLTPVVIGVGDFKNRSQKVDDAIEPLQLMYQAILLAVLDSHVSTANAGTLRSSIDSLDIVASWTWPYADLPSLLSKKLGVEPRHKHYSEHGGNKPGKLFDEAARRISFGESRVAVVTGGEALASLSACAAAEKLPPPGWTKLDQEVTSVFSPTTRPLKEDLGAVHSIGAPIQVYPLFENGFRAHRQQSIQENNKESAELYAEFAKIAEDNPASWSYKQPPASAQIIGTVSKKNRMICFPCEHDSPHRPPALTLLDPLLMNAFNTVNLAGACILTSTEYAEELGVPKRRWIYPLGGAGTEDSRNCKFQHHRYQVWDELMEENAVVWERPNFYSSPSIARSLDAGMEVSGLKKDEIDFYDFYSCFPIVPKLACQHLGLPLTKSPKRATLLGGLTSFGGAGNNYSMHVSCSITHAAHKVALIMVTGFDDTRAGAEKGKG